MLDALMYRMAVAPELVIALFLTLTILVGMVVSDVTRIRSRRKEERRVDALLTKWENERRLKESRDD